MALTYLNRTLPPGQSRKWASVPRHIAPRRLLQARRAVAGPGAELHIATLPNKLEVHCVSESELGLLYSEVFGGSCSYLQCDVDILPGAVVVDVGANIGLFAILSAQRAGANGRVIAFEPVPLLYEACERNALALQGWLQTQGCSAAPIEVLNLGVGSGTVTQTSFMFYTAASGWSSMYPDENEMESNMYSFLDNALSDTSHSVLPDTLPVRLARVLRTIPFARQLYRFLVDTQLGPLLRSAVPVQCDMTTLSRTMLDRKITRIDVLKIDVERAELDVLHGIDMQDWPKIRQVVLEVHDQGGRLERIVQLLSGVGFICAVRQDNIMLGTNLHMVYATRPVI